jgi:hypothetical protein
VIEAVIFDYGGVISAPLLRDLDAFEEQMGYPTGSVHRLMFGDQDHGVVHDFHRLETGEMSLEDYLRGLERRAPEVVGCELDFAAYIEFTRSTHRCASTGSSCTRSAGCRNRAWRWPSSRTT